MIKTFVYDGTFDGLLTCVYDYYYSKCDVEEIVCSDSLPGDFIHDLISVTTSQEKADKVLAAIREKIGLDALKNIFTVFLSEESCMEMLLLSYIKLGFKLGKNIEHHLHNEVVLKVMKTCSRVNFETHRLNGFIRFKCVGKELYYAAIEPDHNILTLLAPHFAERFSNMRWIIHDVKRELAVLYNCEQWVLAPMSRESSKEFISAEDNFYENLWKTYYSTVAIEERENPRLRRRLMPSRYWKYIIEVQ
ncbi:MAG: TIGR03915 family putative DNA repair protein [Bacillota bacterium]|nr:TIGR03915 family putative DNA repair protein [Bacillota bacterium]